MPADSLPPSLLAEIAEGFAAATRLWRPLVRSTLPERRSDRLLLDEHYEVWLLQWGAGHGLELHDHGGSSAAFTVLRGELVELTPMDDGAICRREHREGATVRLPAHAIHDVSNVTATSAVSIHVYSPPLTTMTYYDPITLEPMRREQVDAPAVVALPSRENHPASSVTPRRGHRRRVGPRRSRSSGAGRARGPRGA
jgi:hypothetical protein